jgi:hypothetical protein
MVQFNFFFLNCNVATEELETRKYGITCICCYKSILCVGVRPNVYSSMQCCGSGSTRILIIFQDPGSVPGCLGSGLISYSMTTTKLTGKENLTKYAFCWGPVGPPARKIKWRCLKSTVLGTLPLFNGKDPYPYQTFGSGSVSNWKARSVSVQKWKAVSGSVSKGSGSTTLAPCLYRASKNCQHKHRAMFWLPYLKGHCRQKCVTDRHR